MRTSLLLVTLLPAAALAQPDVTAGLSWRPIGPNRGGRSIAVAGSATRPHEYYFGATGGGVWKTTDGGITWAPVSDGQLHSSSVGALAIAPSNPHVVYAGMGETQLRGNVMQGDGVYRSADGGRTWMHAGLHDSQAIGRLRVDPHDANRVYAAVLGNPFAPSDERGVYRTLDGGRTWTRVLFRSNRAGAVDLVIDPGDPRTLYATMWEVYRTPWMLWSGGAGSGLFKSTDGGDTWEELTRRPGLPQGTLGKLTVAVSGADSRRVYANIEATDGGLHRSDDGGLTWTRVNAHRDLWQRAFYFLRVVADPRDRETVYVLSFQLEKSGDGGRTFRPVPTPHADHHDLWIDPNDPQRLIEANDGGAIVSSNGGRTWTSQRYPTAQLYRVITTADRPYHVCGAQQDNTTVCVASADDPLAPPQSRLGDWYYAVGGGESADIAVRPGDPGVFYAGSTNTLTRFDRRTGNAQDVQPWPRIVMGEPASAMPERWNWTYPIATSPSDPAALFAGSQHLWKSSDEGRTWRRISPDLTRADPVTLGNSGGPIVLDQDGPEIYATIFAIAPSPRASSVIWTGSDDGLVHVTRDGGRSWRNVTPAALLPNSRVSRIDASPHHAGTAWVAVERHQMGDRSPHMWRTTDFGRTWSHVVRGLPDGAFVRVVREDPVRAGLLFAGTEHGVYFSPDAGASWASLARNLPDVQIADLVVKGRDLVIATHGRSFWVLDDISPLREPPPPGHTSYLFPPSPVERRLNVAHLDYMLHAAADSAWVRLETLQGDVMCRLDVPVTPGVHRVRWDLTTPGAISFPGIVLEGGDPARGVLVPPGTYRVVFAAFANGVASRHERLLRVRHDARTGATVADLRAQFALLLRIRDAESEANGAVIAIRAARDRLRERHGAAADTMTQLAELQRVEGELYQVRNQSPKDKIAFPIKLNDRLTGLRAIVESGDGRPTRAQYVIHGQLRAELDALLARLARLLPPIS